MSFVFFVSFVASAQPQLRFADNAASDLLAKSRAAVCGSRGFEGIKTLRIVGRTRAPGEGTATIDGEVEIRISANRYVRIDRSATGVRWSGIVDGKAIGAAAGGLPARLREERAWWTRLLLGAYAGSIDRGAVTLRSADDGAMPETRTLDVDGDGWTGRLVIDAQTHVPMRVVFWGAGAGRGHAVTSFADRRDAGGLLLPHRVTTTTAERVLETLMFDDVAVNPPFTDADFKPPL